MTNEIPETLLNGSSQEDEILKDKLLLRSSQNGLNKKGKIYKNPMVDRFHKTDLTYGLIDY